MMIKTRVVDTVTYKALREQFKQAKNDMRIMRGYIETLETEILKLKYQSETKGELDAITQQHSK